MRALAVLLQCSSHWKTWNKYKMDKMVKQHISVLNLKVKVSRPIEYDHSHKNEWRLFTHLIVHADFNHAFQAYTRLVRPSIPIPRKSVFGSSPWKPMSPHCLVILDSNFVDGIRRSQSWTNVITHSQSHTLCHTSKPFFQQHLYFIKDHTSHSNSTTL